MHPTEWSAFRSQDNDGHDRFFADFVQSEAGTIAKLLLQKRWSIVFSAADMFITSDKPVVVDHPFRETFGLTTPGAVLGFPLSPSRLLIMDDLHDEPPNQYYPLREENLGAFNFTTWRGARRFMITGRSIDRVLQEIDDWADGACRETCERS